MQRYQLSIKGVVSGPHSVDALKEMASIGAFNSSALIAPEGSDAWTAIADTPDMAALFFPERPKMQLKAKAIVPTSDSDQPVSVDQILAGNVAAEARRTAPPPTKRRPFLRRRTIDFLFAITILDVVGAAGWYFLPHNPVVLISVISYIAISNLGIYWVYYHIMDRY